jgi:hypothetical protein
MDDFLHANLSPEMKEGEGEGTCCDVPRPRTPLRQRGFYATNRESILSAWSTRADSGGNPRLRRNGPVRMGGLSVGLVVALGLAISFAVPAFAQQKDTAASQIDEQIVKKFVTGLIIPIMSPALLPQKRNVTAF